MPVYHLHNREMAWIRPYDTRGRLRPEALRRFSRLLRCTHTGKVRAIHWRILVILYDVWLHFGQPQVTIFSGNRPKEVARLKTSKHVTGHAVDFTLDGVSNARIRDYLMRSFDHVGVGYYPNGFHVHLDVRKRKRFWIDYGGPGEAAQYSRDPARDLRLGLAHRGYHPGRHPGRRRRRRAAARTRGPR